jgi:sporulation protein YqfC
MGKKNKNAKAVVGALDLPPEIILGIPKITVLPENEATIQNHKGIIEYTDNFVTVNTSMGVVKLSGQKLFIKSITDEEIQIEGSVVGFEIK